MKLSYTLPLMIFLVVALILYRGLHLHPTRVPSPLINKPAPTFNLPSLMTHQMSSNRDFLNHVTLVNVWATWCVACAEEHAFLLSLAKDPSIVLYGFNYKDQPKTAITWLKEHGNPYKTIAVDQEGITAINWGVYGTPETFIIDKKGIIRYKQIGPLNAYAWEHTLKPIIKQLQGEP